MFKKIVLGLLLIFLIGGGLFYALNSKDDYDSSQYPVYVPAAFTVGSTLDFSLPDQFGEKHALTNETKKLIFTFSKDSAHIMKSFLQQEENGYLNKQSALYIADISTAPTMIRNVFILPELKKSTYPVLLIFEEDVAKKFRYDSQQDAIKVVTLEEKKVKSIEFVKTLEEFKMALN